LEAYFLKIFRDFGRVSSAPKAMGGIKKGSKAITCPNC